MKIALTTILSLALLLSISILVESQQDDNKNDEATNDANQKPSKEQTFAGGKGKGSNEQTFDGGKGKGSKEQTFAGGKGKGSKGKGPGGKPKFESGVVTGNNSIWSNKGSGISGGRDKPIPKHLVPLFLKLGEFQQVKQFHEMNPENIPPPATVPPDIVICEMPKFFKKYRCDSGGRAPPAGPIHEKIALDITKMPFNMDQWIHVDVLPTIRAQTDGGILKIKYALIQISDTKRRVIGRVAERVPCLANEHIVYGADPNTGKSKPITELYENPGVKYMQIFECDPIPELSHNYNPTIGVFNFHPSVEAFYVNFKFTKEETEYLRNPNNIELVAITTLIVDDKGACYVHRVDHLAGLPNQQMGKNSPQIPIQCHGGGPAFIDDEKNVSPLYMTVNSTANLARIKFRTSPGLRPKSRIPFIFKEDWRKKIDVYNMQRHQIDPLGYLPGERAEEKRQKKLAVSAVRRPYLPLIVVGGREGEDEVKKDEVKFDYDDEECDDKLREVPPTNIAEELAKLYFSCGYSTHCIGEPEGCVKEKNCEFVVSWGKSWGGDVTFSMAAYSVAFAALAISKDDQIGDDSVTECCREKNDSVAGYTSWNHRDPSGEVTNVRRRSCESMKEFRAGLVDKYTLFCAWQRPIKTKVKKVEFDLTKPHYLILSTGYESTHGVRGSIGMNEFVKITDQVLLNQYYGKTPFQQIVATLHGLSMIVVWIFVVPLTTFVSRYMKGTYTQVRIWKKYTFWFGMHSIGAVTTSVVTIFSVVFVLATNNHWYHDSGSRLITWHSITGFIVTFLLVCQLGLAYAMLKYKGRWREKVNFKLCHAVLGHITSYTGYFCVFASRHVREGLDCNSKRELICLAICYFLIHAVMSYQVCYSDFVEGKTTSRVYQVFLVDHEDNEAAPAVQEQLEEDEAGSPCRKLMLFGFVALLACFSLYFIFSTLSLSSRDCETEKALQPGIKYKPGQLFR